MKAKLDYVVSTTCGNCGQEIRMLPAWMSGVVPGVWAHSDTGLENCNDPHLIKCYSRWTTGPDELPGVYTVGDQRANHGASWKDCDQCNYVRHQCPGCGEELNHDGTEGTEYGPERMHPNCWEG